MSFICFQSREQTTYRCIAIAVVRFFVREVIFYWGGDTLVLNVTKFLSVGTCRGDVKCSVWCWTGWKKNFHRPLFEAVSANYRLFHSSNSLVVIITKPQFVTLFHIYMFHQNSGKNLRKVDYVSSLSVYDNEPMHNTRWPALPIHKYSARFSRSYL